MPRGIDLTLQVIAKSKNRAAVGALEAAFLSTSKTVRKLAGNILVSRRIGQGFDVIIRHFDPSDAYYVQLVNDNRDKIMPGLHGAVVDQDIAFARQAFRLAYTQNFYEVLPTLASYCLGPGEEEKGTLSRSTDFLRFLGKYTDALEKNNPAEHFLLYNTILPEFSKILVHKIKEYRFTRQEFTLTVYLRLYPFFTESGIDRDLYLQLQLSNSPVYVAAYRRLLKESEPYLFQLITRCLDRLNPPSIVPQIISERADIPFLDALFKSIKLPLTLELKTNLAKLSIPAWIGQIDSFLKEFDTEAQCGLIALVQNINLNELDRLACLLKFFSACRGEARVAALIALSPFSGAEVDRLIWDSADDSDPAVQIEALTQLNSRNIPGAAGRIIQFTESPHAEVRNTIPKLLPNFRFNRFMQTFDQLDEEQRRRMFNIVRHIDQQTAKELQQMLNAEEPVLRAKALLCIDYSHEIVPQVEDELCEVLARDSLPKLRCKAAEQLVAGHRELSRSALVQAFHRDSDPAVRAAAKQSLENRPANWT